MRQTALACAAAGLLLTAVAGQVQAAPSDREPAAAFRATWC